MKLRILILSVAVFLLSLFLLFRHYTNAREASLKEDIATAQSLIKTGKTAIASYDSVYSTVKIGGTKIKSIKFFYEVDGKLFEGTKQLKDLPESATFEIVYLPSHPETNLENPVEELESLTKQLEDKSTSTLPWLLFFGSSAVFFVTRKSYLKEKEENREMEELERQYAKRGKSNGPDLR